MTTKKRTTPRNDQAERATIGGLLIDPEQAPIWVPWLSPDYFAVPEAEETFRAIQTLFRQGKDISPLLITEQLHITGTLHKVSQSTISVFVNAIDSSVLTGNYVDIVIRNGIQRARETATTQHAQNLITYEVLQQRLEAADARLSAYEDWRAGSEEPIRWPDAVDVEPFPVEVLPKPMRLFVEEAAQAIHCPIDFLAVPLLVLAGVAIGTARCIEVKPGWREYARLWAAIVALPGDKKSPALKADFEPFRRRQQHLQQQYEDARKAWQELDKDAKKGAPEPRMAQAFTTDATLEALADVLDVNPRGVLFWRDELAGWARSFNQYKQGKGSDRQNWLSLWSGEPIVVNRRGRKSALPLDNPFVGVAGAIQPEILGELSDERGRQDGFIHRLLFTYPPHMPRKWTTSGLSVETSDAYVDAFARLWDHTQLPTPGTPVLTFTTEGREEWVDWITSHYEEQEAPTFPVHLLGPWSKMEGYAARLALIIHVLRYVCKETTSPHVDQFSMASAADLITYFKSHARRVYDELHTTPEDAQVASALTWIRKQPGRKATGRDVQRAGLKGVHTSDEAKALLCKLRDEGYGSVQMKAARRGVQIIFTLASDPTPDISPRAQAKPVA